MADAASGGSRVPAILHPSGRKGHVDLTRPRSCGGRRSWDTHATVQLRIGAFSTTLSHRRPRA